MFKNFYSYLISLIPLALIIGPLAVEVILIILTLSFIYLSLSKNHYDYYKNKFFLIFILFCFYISISSLFTDEVFISFKSSFFYFRFGFYAVAICYFLEKNKNSINICYWIFTITIIFLLLDSFIQIFLGKNILGYEPQSRDLMRISSFFNDKFILGSFLQKITPVYLYLIFKKFENKNLYLNINSIIVIIMFIITFRSGDRAPLGLLILYGSIFFLIQKKLRKKLLILSGIFFIGIFGLIIQNDSIYKRNVTDTIGQFKGKYFEKYKKSPNEILIFSYNHEAHYKVALRMFLDKPLIGHGVKMFRFKCQEFDPGPDGCATHPHNTYIQLLAETGLFGFTLVMSLFLLIFYMLIKKIFFQEKKQIDLSGILLIGVFVNLWPIIPTGNFFNNWLSVMYFLPVAFYFYEKKIFIKNID